jgi:hypothetical protein
MSICLQYTNFIFLPYKFHLFYSWTPMAMLDKLINSMTLISTWTGKHRGFLAFTCYILTVTFTVFIPWNKAIWMLCSDDSKSKFCQLYWALNLRYFGLQTQRNVWSFKCHSLTPFFSRGFAINLSKWYVCNCVVL